jgi:predicted phage terminase large subunit-like protein
MNRSKIDLILPNHLTIDENFEIELQKFIYKKSYYEFFKKAFTILHPGESYNDNWHVKLICSKLQEEVHRITQKKIKKNDIIINIPFRASKSMICSVIFLPWVWITYPHLKFIYVSFSESLALEHAQFSKNLIHSEWYQKFFGDCFSFNRSEDSKHFYANTNGGFRKSVGTGGAITGSGADFLFCDDAQNPKKAASEKERKNTIDFWNNTLYSRLNQPDIGVRINIQQRLHDQDLSGHLLATNRDQYELIKIPAEITEKSKPEPVELSKNYIDGLFWSTRFSKKILDNYLKTLGSLQYANQLQQETAPEEGNLVKRSWFDIIDAEEITRDVVNEPVHFFVDTAETEKQAGDFTAIVACFKKNNCLYILDVVRYKKEFHESVKFIKDYVFKMRYSESSTIKIEPKSSGKSIVSQLKATTMLNVQEIKLEKGRMEDKLTRLHAIQPLLESRRIILVQGAYINLFLDSLCTFPNAKHDDDVDAFMYAVSDQLGKPDFDFLFI